MEISKHDAEQTNIFDWFLGLQEEKVIIKKYSEHVKSSLLVFTKYVQYIPHEYASPDAVRKRKGWAEHISLTNLMHIKQVFSGIISRMNTDGHTMEVLVRHSEKEKELSLQASRANRLMEFTQESCQAFARDEIWACHIPMGKESSGFFWFVEVGAFLPSAIPEGLLLSGSWNLEVVSNHYLNHQEGLLLFSFPSSFSVFSSSRCGSRLFRRSALISEPVYNLSQCLFFSFDWLNHIHL